ncbi:hypothetical protein EBZ70_09485 [bacterium]|nr:hypothetical protein [bacterium]
MEECQLAVPSTLLQLLLQAILPARECDPMRLVATISDNLQPLLDDQAEAMSTAAQHHHRDRLLQPARRTPPSGPCRQPRHRPSEGPVPLTLVNNPG